MTMTRPRIILAIIAGCASAFAAIGTGWKSLNEAQAARAIAENEPKAKAAYEALTVKVKELEAETKKVHDDQVRLSAYIEGYLKATGAKELPSKELTVIEPPAPVPSSSSSRPPPALPTTRVVIPAVPRPGAPNYQKALPEPSDLGFKP